LDQQISVERIGTDGDTARAAQLYQQLDGQVDAFGVGGIDLELIVSDRRYPLFRAQRLVAGVRHTPVVDGGGLKTTLERGIAQFVEHEIGDQIQPKRALITAGVDRYGSAASFVEAGYQIICGDLGFALGVPIPIRSLRGLRILARILMPFLGRLPLHFLYPTGEKQEHTVPRFGQWYAWATAISGDCLYIKRHMPARLDGKIIVTNTTTPTDVEAFRQRGVRYLITSTPRLGDRTFGTNVMEAALVAAAAKGRPLTTGELQALLDQLNLRPCLQRLNE
jgi:hypothetical protein